MSDNGKKVLTYQSILLNDNITYLKDFQLALKPSVIAYDGTSAIIIQDKLASIFDANGYNELRRILLPNFGGDTYWYSSILPFYYQGTQYAAVTYADSKYQFKTIITKL